MFVLKGVAGLSPDLIAKSRRRILSLTLPKSRTERRKKRSLSTPQFCPALQLSLSVLVVVVFLGVNRDMAKHYQEQAKFSLAKSYFQIVLKQIRSCRNT